MRDENRFAQAVEITTATYDQAAPDYARRREAMPSHWSERMERFIYLLEEELDRHPLLNVGLPDEDSELAEYLQFLPVLDAGCGAGRDARALATYNLPVLGIDLSAGMLTEAADRTARRLPQGRVRYELMDLRQLELPESSCRGIWCSASLLHIPKLVAPRAVAELARVAREGAPAAIFLKAQGDMDPQEFQEYEYGGISGKRFFAYYTPEQARHLLEAAGFTVTEEMVFPGAEASSPDWISLLARKS
jgi:SAM-dependent methyltransferase